MAESNYSHINGILAGAFIKKRVQITSSTTSGVILSVQNPEGFLPNNIQGAGAGAGDVQDGLGWIDGYITPGEVQARECAILMRKIPAAACGLDIGIGPSPTGDYAQFFSNKALHTMPVNTIYNTVLDGATQGNRVYMAASDYLNVTVKSGDANGAIFDVFMWADMIDQVESP